MPAYIRILNASPGAPQVDVYVDGQRYINNLAYREFSEYFDIPPGSHQITLYRAGQQANPLARENINVEQQTIQTVAAVGRPHNMRLKVIPDPRIGKSEEYAYVRFAHLSPNAPQVDLRLQDGKTIAQGIKYGSVSNYTPIQPGTKIFNLYVAGTNQRMLYVPNIRMQGNRIYTVYAIGLAGGTPQLQLLFPLDGNSYL